MQFFSCLCPSQVLVVVAESSAFEFVSPDNREFSMDNVRKVSVLSQNITTLLFPIRATALGDIPISVKATSIYSSDWVYKTVLVKVIQVSMMLRPKIKNKLKKVLF